jgi:hypothetical protein
MVFEINKSFKDNSFSYHVILEPNYTLDGNWYKLLEITISTPELIIYYSNDRFMIDFSGKNEINLDYRSEFTPILIPEQHVNAINNGEITLLWKNIRIDNPLDEMYKDEIEGILKSFENLIKNKI